MKTQSISIVLVGCLVAGCAFAQAPGPASASRSVVEAKPFRGPLKPDLPLAKAYNDAARALAGADDNPLIGWEYRIWCETGYRDPEDAGAGQDVDKPLDIERDYISPGGFFHKDTADRLMPEDGVRFLDNVWYFGADGLGVVVVKSTDGLLLFDTMTNPGQYRLVASQMKAAGLDPTEIRYIFIGHYHWDHTGGINAASKLAPNAPVVIGEPDAELMMNARKAVLAGTTPDTLMERKAMPFGDETADTPEGKAALRARRLEAIPGKFDILVKSDPGVRTGMDVIEVGPSTRVYAVLAPGHTPGQTHYIVPVKDHGQMRHLLVMSGNDGPEQARQYAESTNYLRAIAGQVGADTVINTHGYQSAMFYHLRQLKARPDGPNPFAMGPDGIDRYLGIFAECQRATYNRLKDGTWKAF